MSTPPNIQSNPQTGMPLGDDQMGPTAHRVLLQDMLPHPTNPLQRMLGRTGVAFAQGGMADGRDGWMAIKKEGDNTDG